MTPSRARFVTVCQQLLALGVVVVALVPATRVVSLDVVGVQPGSAERPTLRIEPSVDVPTGASSARLDRPAPSIRVAERSGERRAARHALRVGDGVEAGRTGP